MKAQWHDKQESFRKDFTLSVELYFSVLLLLCSVSYKSNIPSVASYNGVPWCARPGQLSGIENHHGCYIRLLMGLWNSSSGAATACSAGPTAAVVCSRLVEGSDNRERSNSAPSPFSSTRLQCSGAVAKILELVGGGNLMDKANLSCSAISCVHSGRFLSSRHYQAEKAVVSLGTIPILRHQIFGLFLIHPLTLRQHK